MFGNSVEFPEFWDSLHWDETQMKAALNITSVQSMYTEYSIDIFFMYGIG